MEIVFTNHAEAKLRQRRISKDFVIKTVLSPDFIQPSYGKREAAYKKIGKNYLKVIFKKENDKLAVITQHWVAKLIQSK